MQQAGRSSESPQYGLGKILLIWAASALPMGLVVWVIVPFLIPRVDIVPGFMTLSLIALVQVWLGVLSYTILRREVKPFTWANLKDRLWLHTPTNPRTGLSSKLMFLWLIPWLALRLTYFYVLEPFGWLDDLWLQAFPSLAAPAYAVIQNLAGPAVGQWWLLGVLAVLQVFNYLLGEELIFRGVLLPKMNGVFGKWDWLANGILFTTYHIHLIWDWPSNILIDWIYPWVAKRFKSYWMSVILHGSDAPVVIVLFVLAILGMV